MNHSSDRWGRGGLLALAALLVACAESTRTTLFESLPSPQRDFTLDVFVIEPWFPQGPYRIAIELVRGADNARERLVDTTLAYDGVPFTKQNIAARWIGARAAFVCLSATDRPDQGIQISASADAPAVVEQRTGC